jgi:MFS family permease
MKLTSILIVLVPLWWVFTDNTICLVVIQLIGGFVWGGFNLAASNFIYDAVTPEKRTRCIAYFNMMNGIALSIGAILGGFLVSHLPPVLGHRIRALFCLSSFLRMLPVILILPLIKEVRSVRKTSSTDLFFSVIGLRPLLGLSRETTIKLIRR